MPERESRLDFSVILDALEDQEKTAAEHGDADERSGVGTAFETLDSGSHEVAADQQEYGVCDTVVGLQMLASGVEDIRLIATGDDKRDQGDAEGEELHKHQRPNQQATGRV